jgi:hypothetical protein
MTTFNPGNMAEPGVQRLRMLRGRTARRSHRGAHHHRHLPLSARHVMDFGGLVHHLVHGQRDEVAEHDVDHRTHSGHRRAHGKPGEARFGNRRIEHALFAELFEQAGKHLERRAGFGHILAQNADAFVAAHLFGQRLANRLRECQFAIRNRLRHTRPRPLHRERDKAPRRRTRPPSSFRTRFRLHGDRALPDRQGLLNQPIPKSFVSDRVRLPGCSSCLER